MTNVLKHWIAERRAIAKEDKNGVIRVNAVPYNYLAHPLAADARDHFLYDARDNIETLLKIIELQDAALKDLSERTCSLSEQRVHGWIEEKRAQVAALLNDNVDKAND